MSSPLYEESFLSKDALSSYQQIGVASSGGEGSLSSLPGTAGVSAAGATAPVRATSLVSAAVEHTGPFKADGSVFLEAWGSSGLPALSHSWQRGCSLFGGCATSVPTLLSTAAWLLLAALLSLAGLAVGATSSASSRDPAEHAQLRGVLYFTSICIVASLIGQAIDAAVFLLCEAFARSWRVGAVLFFYASAFRGILMHLTWLIVALSTFDFVLVPGTLVSLDIAMRVLILLGAIISAAGCKRLAFKLMLTEFIMSAQRERLVGALEGRLIARVLSTAGAAGAAAAAAACSRCSLRVARACAREARWRSHSCRPLSSRAQAAQARLSQE